jgi:hypothetical protein
MHGDTFTGMSAVHLPLGILLQVGQYQGAVAGPVCVDSQELTYVLPETRSDMGPTSTVSRLTDFTVP